MVTDLVELVRSLEREDGMVPAEELLQAAAGLPDREAAWEAERREFLLKELFWKAGAREAEYLAYRCRKEAVFGEDGALQNGEELVLKAKEELPEFFARRQPRLAGVRPQEGRSSGCAKQSLEGMSYAERAELFSRDKELYRRLRGF